MQTQEFSKAFQQQVKRNKYPTIWEGEPDHLMEKIVIHNWKTNLHGVNAQHSAVLSSLEQRNNDIQSLFQKNIVSRT